MWSARRAITDRPRTNDIDSDERRNTMDRREATKNRPLRACRAANGDRMIPETGRSCGTDFQRVQLFEPLERHVAIGGMTFLTVIERHDEVEDLSSATSSRGLNTRPPW